MGELSHRIMKKQSSNAALQCTPGEGLQAGKSQELCHHSIVALIDSADLTQELNAILPINAKTLEYLLLHVSNSVFHVLHQGQACTDI